MLTSSTGTARYPTCTLDQCVLELEPDLSLRTLTSPRILATHVGPEDMPREYFRRRPKTVYVMRDPKDVAVSWFYFYKAYPADTYEGKWDDWLGLFLREKWMWGTWHNHIRSFEELFKTSGEDNVHLVFYESMKQNPLEEIRRLDAFLKTGASMELLGEVADMCSFANTKAYRDEKADTAEDKYPSYGDFYSHQYRKGVVGDWQNFFTREQKTEFDDVYRKRMAGSAHEKHYVGEERHYS